MDEQSYPFRTEQPEFTYSFESVNELKTVRKKVVFTVINSERLYNLALLDELPDGTFSDSSVTNNDDLIMVLATVFRIIADFTNRFSGSFVYFSGSDAHRIRLCRIAITHELERLEKYYIVLGRRGTDILPLVPNEEYDGFLIKKQ